MLAALDAYKENHGDCNVPPNWPEDPKLARWVDEQRLEWMKGTLSGKRFWRLRSTGFEFAGQRRQGLFAPIAIKWSRVEMYSTPSATTGVL